MNLYCTTSNGMTKLILKIALSKVLYLKLLEDNGCTVHLRRLVGTPTETLVETTKLRILEDDWLQDISEESNRMHKIHRQIIQGYFSIS